MNCDALLQLMVRHRSEKIIYNVLLLDLPDRPIPKFTHVSRWNNDEYSCGSYSFLPTDGAKDAFKILSEPLPGDKNDCPYQVLFAGEATHSLFFSTIHGAYLSGEREATRLSEWYSAQAKK